MNYGAFYFAAAAYWPVSNCCWNVSLVFVKLLLHAASNAGRTRIGFFMSFTFFLFLLKIKNRPANKAVGEFTNQLIIDSAAFGVLRPLLYGRQLPDPISPRPGIHNDTNTMKHRINDVCYLHRTSQACDSPEPTSLLIHVNYSAA